MAIVDRNLKASRTLTNVKDFQSTAQEPALFAAVAGSPRYPQLLPLYFDSAATPPAWKQWVSGQVIGAFLLGQDGMSLGESGTLQTSSLGEVIGTIIKGGVIPYDQIPDPTAYTPTQTVDNLKIALRDGMRAKGFFITNLDNVR